MTQPAPPAPQAGPQGAPTNQPTPQPPAPAQPPQPTSPPTPPAAPAPTSGPESWPEEARKKITELNAENASWRTKFRQAEPLLEALGGKTSGDTKTDLEKLTERFETYEQQVTEERIARFRAEVAQEKGLTAAQAKRLVGKTKEELLTDADDFIASMPAPPTPAANGAPHTPVEALRPGSMPQPPAPDINALIADAKKRGDVMTVIALENSKLANLPKR